MGEFNFSKLHKNRRKTTIKMIILFFSLMCFEPGDWRKNESCEKFCDGRWGLRCRLENNHLSWKVNGDGEEEDWDWDGVQFSAHWMASSLSPRDSWQLIY